MSYNNIFERFIANENEEVPLIQIYIAYAQYKNEKKDWIIDQFQKQGRRPTPSEVEMYVGTWTDLRIKNTIRQSRDVVDVFRDSIMEQYSGDYENIAYDNTFKRFEAKIGSIETLLREKMKRSVWKEAGIGALGNFLWVICTIAFVILGAFVVDSERLVKAFKILAGFPI